MTARRGRQRQGLFGQRADVAAGGQRQHLDLGRAAGAGAGQQVQGGDPDRPGRSQHGRPNGADTHAAVPSTRAIRRRAGQRP